MAGGWGVGVHNLTDHPSVGPLQGTDGSTTTGPQLLTQTLARHISAQRTSTARALDAPHSTYPPLPQAGGAPAYTAPLARTANSDPSIPLTNSSGAPWRAARSLRAV